MSPLHVRHFERKPLAGVFSIERVFETVRAALPPDIAVSVRKNRFASRGVLPRLLDALLARRHAAEVNHVLGDVHYLTWFLPRRGTILTVHDCASLARLHGLRRRLLWLACPVLMYWLTRYWFLAQRRETHDDPVVFALKDKQSLLAGLATALIVAAASLRL